MKSTHKSNDICSGGTFFWLQLHSKSSIRNGKLIASLKKFLSDTFYVNFFFLKEPFWDMSEHTVFFFFFNFIYLWLCWVFVSVRGLSLVVASGGHSSPRCADLSLSRPLLLRSTGSRCAGSVIVAHGPSCSVACGIFPDQGSNPCPLHWQADSQPLCHQGSPYVNYWMDRVPSWFNSLFTYKMI